MSKFFKRNGDADLEAELRRARPEPRPEFVEMLSDRLRSERRRSARPALRVGFAGAVTAAMLIALAAVGGLGYAATAVKTAATAVTRVVTPAKPHVVQVSAAADQYGNKASVCAVQPNGKQHTINISRNAEASYLRHHPSAYAGSCGAFRPAGAKANVCVRLRPGKYAAVFVPSNKVKGYLKRNFKSHRTKTGKC